MVRTPVADHIDVAIFCYIIDKPRNFIGMCFNHDFKLRVWIEHPYCCSVVVCKICMDKRLDIIQPNLLPGSLKSSRRGIVKVRVEEFFVLLLFIVYWHTVDSALTLAAHSCLKVFFYSSILSSKLSFFSVVSRNLAHH